MRALVPCTFPQAPVLITETAVAPGPQQVRGCAAGSPGVQIATRKFGLVWFDLNRREAWHLRPGAVRQCSAEARSYR
jgi:hypothetical protein